MANEQKTYELTAERRTLVGKESARLLKQGLLPAVVYGHNVEAESLQIPKREFEHIYMRAGSTTLLDLRVGEGDVRKVFIHNVQRAPTHHGLTHVDFLAVNLREEMTAAVALVLVGESPAVTGGEGLLLQQLEHINVKALPANIPHLVEVDVSGLTEVDQVIRVGDLKFEEGVAVLTPEDELIVRVSSRAHIAAEEPTAAEEAAAAAETEAAEAAEGGEGGKGDDSDKG